MHRGSPEERSRAVEGPNVTGFQGHGSSSSAVPEWPDKLHRDSGGLVRRLTRRQLETLSAVSLGESSGYGVALQDVATELNIQPPSALAHLDRLEALGLVRRYRGKSWSTQRGRNCLEEYLRRHRVIETLLWHAGLPAQVTHAAALEIDLSLRPRTVNEVCRAQGHPVACPHGLPISHLSATRKRLKGWRGKATRGLERPFEGLN
ncbi:MAG: metal-dependent transcriptional regulator [Thermoplasmata archaeon]